MYRYVYINSIGICNMEGLETQQSVREIDSRQGVYEELNQYFNDQNKEQKITLEAREILGDSAEKLTDEEVYSLVSEVQYLTDCWFEEFERKVFNGKTLTELIGLGKHEYKQ